MRTPQRWSILFVATLVAPGVTACAGDSEPVGAGSHARADARAAADPASMVRYDVAILSSLGGTSSEGNGINNRGWVAGYSDLSSDTIRHATVWRDGSMIDLGTLGGPNSNVVWPGLNNGGMVVGISEMAEVDTLGQSFSCWVFFPTATGHVCRGFVWESGEMTALPALGGQNSFATGVNARGQVVGWAETAVHDPTCVQPDQVLQFRAVLWEPKKGRIRELPPLPGDSVSAATAINDRGQVVGISGACGVAVGGVSARRAVLWEKGTVTDIGDLGGDAWNTPMAINARGDVVGFALAADGSALLAFRWTESDGVESLGTLPGDVGSQALGINARGEVVGVSDGPDGFTAVLWRDTVITDLNTLVAPGFSGHLRTAGHISDSGVITGSAVDPATRDTVTYVATPVRR